VKSLRVSAIMRRVNDIELSKKDRQRLLTIVGRPSESAGLVRRCRVVLFTGDGVPATEIAERLALTPEAVSRIRRRFLDEGVDGLFDRPKSGRTDHAVPSDVVEKLIGMAMSPPPPGRSRWTTRLLGKAVNLTGADLVLSTIG
jgi:hypothetical protein